MRFSESTHLLVYVFGDFNVHHKDWLTLIGGTEGMLSSVIIYLNLNDLSQMVKFRTRNPDCDSHSSALGFIYFF